MIDIKNKGYVIVSISIILSIISVLLTVIMSKNILNIDVIKNYKLRDLVIQHSHAVELVIIDNIKTNYMNTNSLLTSSNDPFVFKAPQNQLVTAEVKYSDGCVNLRSLVYRHPNGLIIGREIEIKRARYIFEKLQLNESLINQIIDWQDTDEITKDGKNENLIFIKNGKKHRPRNDLMVHISELNMIGNITNEEFLKLKNYFCVNVINPKINVNALDAEKLSLFFPFLNINEANLVFESIKNGYVKDRDSFKQNIELAIRRMLLFDDEDYLKNTSYSNHSMQASINIETELDEIWNTQIQYEVDYYGKIHTIFRYGPKLVN